MEIEPMYDEAKKQILELIKKSSTVCDSNDAMRFSQAALNCANAISQLNNNVK